MVNSYDGKTDRFTVKFTVADLSVVGDSFASSFDEQFRQLRQHFPP